MGIKEVICFIGKKKGVVEWEVEKEKDIGIENGFRLKWYIYKSFYYWWFKDLVIGSF